MIFFALHLLVIFHYIYHLIHHLTLIKHFHLLFTGIHLIQNIFPYGQSLFIRALESPITQEDYDKYKETVKDSFQSFVNLLKTKYSLDCLLTIGNDDLFCGTTVCGIPRANLTLDYYNPDHNQINVVAVGFSHGDDLLLLRFLQRLEKANLQAGKIDTRTPFQKYVQGPVRSVYQNTCSIL